MDSEDFDINKKVEEIPVEELDGFFHDIDLENEEEVEKEGVSQGGEQIQKSELNHFL